MNAEDLLHAAREAWSTRERCDRELSRLRKYHTQTPGMRSDRARWETQRGVADATLRRILGGEHHEHPEP